jgi:hypothetical protein
MGTATVPVTDYFDTIAPVLVRAGQAATANSGAGGGIRFPKMTATGVFLPQIEVMMFRADRSRAYRFHDDPLVQIWLA